MRTSIQKHSVHTRSHNKCFYCICSKAESEKPWYKENDTQNDIAKKAFEALMTVTLRKPDSPEYKEFSRKVKERAQMNGSNFTYGEEEVCLISFFQHSM